MSIKIISVIFMFSIISCINGAKILGVFQLPSYSHFQLGDRIFRALAEKGHQATLIAPYAEKTPTLSLSPEENIDAFTMTNTPIIIGMLFLSALSAAWTESVLKHPNVQMLLKSNETFDLVIIEQGANEAFQGFCYYYKAPCVILSSNGANTWVNRQVANPGSPSYIPELLAGFNSQMNFWERLYNSVLHTVIILSMEFLNFPAQNKLLQKYFPGAPHLSELYYNTSLVLLNSNPALGKAVPILPNMVEIGGAHIKSPRALPKDLQDFLDTATDGAIFFSLGSHIKSKDMPIEKRNAVLRAFSKLEKVKVLWKWEDESLPGKPDNVKISKWIPQQEILAHPNLKLFISHGGIFSTTEAVYHGVPIIGVPLYGDQKTNVAVAEDCGYAIKLGYNELNEETLGLAISKIFNDARYTENVKRRSQALRDQPKEPLENAIFWIEYVIRHKGALHLRTAALSLTWYQYLLLDVVAFVVILSLVSFYIFLKLLQKVCGKRKCKKNIPRKKNN